MAVLSFLPWVWLTTLWDMAMRISMQHPLLPAQRHQQQQQQQQHLNPALMLASPFAVARLTSDQASPASLLIRLLFRPLNRPSPVRVALPPHHQTRNQRQHRQRTSETIPLPPTNTSSSAAIRAVRSWAAVARPIKVRARSRLIRLLPPLLLLLRALQDSSRPHGILVSSRTSLWRRARMYVCVRVCVCFFLSFLNLKCL